MERCSFDNDAYFNPEFRQPKRIVAQSMLVAATMKLAAATFAIGLQ
jgi:hypothetical protein